MPPRRRHARSLAPLILRLVLGTALLIAGFVKLFPLDGDGHRNIVVELQRLGMPVPEILSWVVGGAELLCGLALLLGARTKPAAIVMVLNLAGLLVICLVKGIWYPESLGLENLRFYPYRLPSLEAAGVFVAGLVSLVLSGPGRYSLDHRA